MIRWFTSPYLDNLSPEQIAVLVAAAAIGDVCPDDCRAHCHAPTQPRQHTATAHGMQGCMRPKVPGEDTCRMHRQGYVSPRTSWKHRSGTTRLPQLPQLVERPELVVHELGTVATNRLSGYPFIVTACQVSVPFGDQIFAVSATYRSSVNCAGCIAVATTGRTEAF